MSTSAPRSYRRQFSANVLFGLGGRIGQWAIGFFLVAYVIRRLGAERFSLVVVATTTVAFISLLQLGASAGIGKQLNALRARGESNEFTGYYTASVILASALAAVMALALAVVLTALWPVLNIPIEHAVEGRLVLVGVGVAAVSSCLRLPSQAAQQAIHRIDLVEKLNLVGLVVRLVGVILGFSVFAPSAAVYAVVLAGEGLITLLMSHAVSRALLPEARVILSATSRGTYAAIVRFNLLTFFDSFNYVLFMQAPVFVLQHCGGPTAAGSYGVGLQLNNAVRGVFLAVLNAISPLVMSLEATSRYDDLRAVFRTSTRAFASAAALLWVDALLLGKPFVELWLGREMPALTDALPWLVAASAVGIATMPSAVVVVAVRQVRAPAVTGAVLATAMVAGMVPLVGGGGQGALTRAAVALFVFFAAYQAIRFAVATRALGIRIREVLRIALRSAAPGAAVLPPLYWAVRHVPMTSWWVLVSVAVGTIVLGAAPVWYVVMNGQERRAFVEALGRKRSHAVEVGRTSSPAAR
jgi:membrane protein EpsK